MYILVVEPKVSYVDSDDYIKFYKTLKLASRPICYIHKMAKSKIHWFDNLVNRHGKSSYTDLFRLRFYKSVTPTNVTPLTIFSFYEYKLFISQAISKLNPKLKSAKKIAYLAKFSKKAYFSFYYREKKKNYITVVRMRSFSYIYTLETLKYKIQEKSKTGARCQTPWCQGWIQADGAEPPDWVNTWLSEQSKNVQWLWLQEPYYKK